MTAKSLTFAMLLIGSVLVSLFWVGHVYAATPSYTAGVKVGDWWNYGSFEGRCQTSCPSGFQEILNINEATATVVAKPNSTSVTVKNTIAFNNQTIRTFITLGDLSSGKGNLSFVSSMLIAGGLTTGQPISKATSAPIITENTIALFAGANRTLNILNDTTNQRVYQWDQTSGILASFSQNQANAHLYYRLTGTNLWRYKIAIYDGSCGPDSPVSCGYTPIQTTIIALTTVTYSNTGTLTHSVYSCTPDSNPPPSPSGCNFINYPLTAPSFASGNILPGKTWNLTFPEPGLFYYFDANYPNMKAVIYVIGNATTPPSFNVTASPNPIVIPQGLSSGVTILVNGLNGYTGPVTLSDTFPTGPNYPTTNGAIGETGYFYGGGYGPFGVSIGIYTSINTPQGVYDVALTGTGNNLTVTTIVPIIVVVPTPSFYLTPYGNTSINMISGHAISLTVTVHSVAGFTGPVSLATYSYSGNGILFASISPGSVTLGPDSSANATLTLNGGYPGNFTVGVFADIGDPTYSQRTFFNIQVHQVVGLLLYQLFYVGTLQPSSSLLLVNRFTNIGNIPDQALYGTISIDFGTYSFTVIPLQTLQPNETSSYNLTITIPADATPGDHTVTATLIWQAQLTEFWIRAPPLTLQGQLPVQAPPETPPESPPPTGGGNNNSTATTLLGSFALAVKNNWLLALAIYTPFVLVLTNAILLFQRARAKSRQE